MPSSRPTPLPTHQQPPNHLKVTSAATRLEFLQRHTRRPFDGQPNPLIRTAAANSRHGCINVGIRRFRRFVEQRIGRHQHAGLAITALRHLLGYPGQLQGVRLFRCTQRLNRLTTLCR